MKAFKSLDRSYSRTAIHKAMKSQQNSTLFPKSNRKSTEKQEERKVL